MFASAHLVRSRPLIGDPGGFSRRSNFFEANVIAACAVLDEPTLFRILNYGELHDFPKEMLKFRMKVVEQLRM